MRPTFEVVAVGNNCYTINDRGRTVALVTSQGYIDWLLPSPEDEGPLYTEIVKETHLSYTLGFKLLLITPTPATELTAFDYRLEENGARLVLIGHGVTGDGSFASLTTAVLTADAAMEQYLWEFETIITCLAQEPITFPYGIEYNNVYPSKAGRCMLFAPQKEYDCTLMTDKDGVVWRFPHQHMMHYGSGVAGKIGELNFAPGTTAGFFGDPSPKGCPVVIVKESTLEPLWCICDMYYDLHCQARLNAPAQPGDVWRFAYQIKYLDRLESDRMLVTSRPVPVTTDDWGAHNYPRFELGMNTFTNCCNIDRPDDCSGFRPRPPQKVWDREVGHRTKGSLRITNTESQETAWGAEPPTQIPAETTLNITAKVKTDGVEGKGMFIRVRYHTFVWQPTPHVEWTATLESTPVTGTTDGWVQVTVPALEVPKEHFDYLLWIEVVLDGKGTAWLTDVDIDLQYATPEIPVLEEGGLDKAVKFRPRSKAGAAPM